MDLEDENYKKITQVADTMKMFRKKGELGRFLAEELLKYSMHDLQIIGARAKDEIDILPMPYREKFRPHAKEWFFGRYHRLILSYRQGDFKRDEILITDLNTYLKYCEMIPAGCFDKEKEEHRFVDEEKAPYYDLFYYLLCAYAMFVTDEPGHPVGTPFPGGFEVTKNGEGYFCPIRDKEEEIFHSICNFCPAKQDEKNL